MGIVEFLEARIAEDEAVAKAARPGPWRYEPGCSSGPRVSLTDFLMVPEDVGAPCNDMIPYLDSRHIARQDPARILREVAAKRAVITQSREADEYYAHMSGNGRIASMAAGNVNACAAILKALASVYDDHPDFSEEWRP